MKKVINAVVLFLIVLLFTGCMETGDKEIYSRLEQEDSGFVDDYEKLKFERPYYIEDDLEIVISDVNVSFSKDGILSLEYECILNNLLDKDNFIETILCDGWLRIKEPLDTNMETSSFPDGCTFGSRVKVLDENGNRIGYLNPKESLTAILKVEELLEKEYIEESIKNNGNVVGYCAIQLGKVGYWINLNDEALLSVL